jgi:hypothetical protein
VIPGRAGTAGSVTPVTAGLDNELHVELLTFPISTQSHEARTLWRGVFSLNNFQEDSQCV